MRCQQWQWLSLPQVMYAERWGLEPCALPVIVNIAAAPCDTLDFSPLDESSSLIFYNVNKPPCGGRQQKARILQAGTPLGLMAYLYSRCAVPGQEVEGGGGAASGERPRRGGSPAERGTSAQSCRPVCTVTAGPSGRSWYLQMPVAPAPGLRVCPGACPGRAENRLRDPHGIRLPTRRPTGALPRPPSRPLSKACGRAQRALLCPSLWRELCVGVRCPEWPPGSMEKPWNPLPLPGLQGHLWLGAHLSTHQPPCPLA